jgi:hypothetical protein
MQTALHVSDSNVVGLIHPLLGKPRSSWSKDEVAKIISLLKNRNCIVLGGCSEESISDWLSFYREWEAYEDEHPDVEALVDPSSQISNVDPPMVCFTFAAAGPPAGFAAAVAATDANVGVLPVLCSDGNASSTLFITNTTETAHFFAGRMRGLFPAVFSHTLNARAAPFAW